MNNRRKCIITFKLKDKKDLIRVVKNNNNKIKVNSNEKGRGAYISKDYSLWEKIKKQKSLNRVFRMDVNSKIYEELKEVLKKESTKCPIKEN